MKSELMISCPKCTKRFSYYESEFRPFCTERCKMVDLGQWLEEDYAIPGQEVNVEDEFGETDGNEED